MRGTPDYVPDVPDDRRAPRLPVGRQELAYAIWAEIIRACEAYYLDGVTTWPGNRDAPEWPDAVVAAQVRHWNGYQHDYGAMMWRGNDGRDSVFDFESLPHEWQRAICERVWVLCRDAGLAEDEAYRSEYERWRKT